MKRCVEIQQKKNAENICKIGTYAVVRSERFDYATLYAPKKLQNTPTKRENFDGTLYPPKKIQNTQKITTHRRLPRFPRAG